MPGPQVETLIRQIQAVLPRTQSLDAAVEEVVSGLESLLPSFRTSHTAEIAEARREVEKQFEDVEILHKHSVIRRKPRWYFGSRPTDLHWPKLKAYMLSKDWAGSDIEAIDEASNEIVSLLECPAQEQFSGRGLVVARRRGGHPRGRAAAPPRG